MLIFTWVEFVPNPPTKLTFACMGRVRNTLHDKGPQPNESMALPAVAKHFTSYRNNSIMQYKNKAVK